jgi:ankyrin repeat protein
MQSAIDSGNLDSFKYLLQLKLDESIDINQILDHEGNSLLCKSILYNQYDFVKYLIDYYPSLINTKNCYGAYPIHLSALNGW